MAQVDNVTAHSQALGQSNVWRDLVLGLVKVRVLHQASREPVYGAGITSELQRYGLRVSSGTLYPLLHTLEAADLLERQDRVVAGKVRKYYRITALGRRALDLARRRLVDLVNEVTETRATTNRGV